jgi:two-component system NtrC family sensor kinase
MAAPEDLQEVESPHARRLEAFAAAANRLERESDLHAAAAHFLSVLRQQASVRRAVLTVADAEGRDQRWFFAGLTDADIDFFHAHRAAAVERDGLLAEKHRTGRVFSVPVAACRDGGGFRNPAGGELLVLPWHGVAGQLLGMLLIEDGRERAGRDAAEIAAIELFGAAMARLLERQSLDRSARRTETSLRQAQEQLMQADKLSSIGQLISGVAHELNNPLSAVMGFTQLLQASETQPKARQHLDRVYNEAVRCQKIVQNLLSVARRHRPEKAAHRLNDVIEEVLDLRAYQMQVDDVTIERRFAPDLPMTLFDAHQIQQVVLNLVNNAHHAMLANGSRPRRLTVTTAVEEGLVTARFADTGGGIPTDRVQRLFEPFFTTKEPGKGTGLGLSVSLGIMRDHEGTLTVESVVGEGSSFRFTLPLVACAAAPQADPRPRAGMPAAITGLRILVVDDEPVLTELLGDLLKSVGHEVDNARDGRVALRLTHENRYDLILTDLKMPGLDGQGLYEQVCRERPEMRSRFIFSTGDVVNPDAQGFLKGSGCAYLSKPFKLETVLQLVDEVGRARAA